MSDSKTQQVVAFIGARGGSQRVKRKNVEMIAGKPLVAHTIVQALESQIFTRVIVNSEDAEILAIAKDFGAEAYKRPEALGAGTVYVIQVIQEMIQTLDLSDNTILSTLFPTVPLKEVQDIRNAYELFVSKGGETPLVSVTPYEYPPQLALDLDEEGCITPFMPEHYNKSTRHNDHKPMYRANYAVLFNTVKNLKAQTNLIGHKPIAYTMPLERSIDIDDPYQMLLAKTLMEKNND